MEINAKTNLYCIFGSPVKHSLSPAMHNAAFDNLELNNKYMAFEPKNIADAVTAMKTLNIKGASVTIPFKTDVIDYLDEIDPLAKKIGAVNTLANIEGKIIGYNTDGIGAYKALKEVYSEIDNSNILIIGNGGSARAIAFTLLEKNCKVTIAGRKSEQHINLVETLKQYNNNVMLAETKKLTANDTKDFNVIINTTPLGMKPETDPLPINSENIYENHVVFDIVYSPHETPLLKQAVLKNAKIVYGIEMLINQGTEQFTLWTKKPAPTEIFRNTLMSKIYNK